MDQLLFQRMFDFLIRKIRIASQFIRDFRYQLRCEIANEHLLSTDTVEFYAMEPILRRYGNEALHLQGDALESYVTETAWQRNRPLQEIYEFQRWYYDHYVPRSFKKQLRKGYLKRMLQQFFYA
ncbi:MAG: hypothetical protein P4L51_23785 [Puia sp.]|nr:hypothetical protein [Puia sp.]